MSEENENRFKVTFGRAKYRVLPTGFYKAKLVFLRDGTGKFEQPIYRLTFLILDASAGIRPKLVDGLINQNENGKYGKLWQLKKAFDEKECGEGESIYIESFLQKECFIRVEQRGHQNAITEYISLRDFQDIR